ncbi:MAG: hypothetical protein ACRCUB_08590, partial [Plesiomonas shigelloides]
YGDGNVPFRFIITRTIMLRTQDVAKIDEAYKQSSQLVDSGVILSNEGVGSGNPVYLYNGLTTLTPAMIAEATKMPVRLRSSLPMIHKVVWGVFW